jgi:hypothetical protein
MDHTISHTKHYSKRHTLKKCTSVTLLCSVMLVHFFVLLHVLSEKQHHVHAVIEQLMIQP